jgi:nucleoside 2-deoxyribosyltransferase
MKIFISWSKRKSMEMAIKTKELLEDINPQVNAFVSEVDINGGEDVQKKIIEKINECDKLVLCFTSENKRAPWLLFEAGYARGRKKTVIPMLFDYDSNWHSWIDNPMNIAREVNFNSYDFNISFFNSFNFTDSAANRRKLEKYKLAISEIKDKFRQVDVECEDFVEKLICNDAFVLESPYFREKAAFFLTGFESFDLYKAIIESFLYTGKYLWIYGRKNMKLFGGSFKTFFKYLDEKTSSVHQGMDGIDFRCLFLNPDSDEVQKAHLQQNIFKPELEATILRAKDVIGDNHILKRCFRFYSNRREDIVIRIDNTIVYSRPTFDANGRPQLLTDTGFEVFSVSSPKGKKCIDIFENVWNESKEME